MFDPKKEQKVTSIAREQTSLEAGTNEDKDKHKNHSEPNKQFKIIDSQAL